MRWRRSNRQGWSGAPRWWAGFHPASNDRRRHQSTSSSQHRAPTLERALASIAAQDHPAIEIVIVAASGSAHPALPGAIGSCRIVEVRRQDRLPRAEAADAGIRAATGDWITFLDDDDELLPGHITGLVAAAAANPEVRAVTGRALATFRNGRTEVWGQRFALSELCARNFVHLSTLLFHRSLLAHGLAFDPNLHLHEDWDLALQIAQHAIRRLSAGDLPVARGCGHVGRRRRRQRGRRRIRAPARLRVRQVGRGQRCALRALRRAVERGGGGRRGRPHRCRGGRRARRPGHQPERHRRPTR
jgi:GT2 family glycosyltransferase